jgi:hypothetical protein
MDGLYEPTDTTRAVRLIGEAMNSSAIPDILSLETDTIELLRAGISDSNSMREQLAIRYEQLSREDQAWKKFVNNHAWALVRLQEQGRIRKIAPSHYMLVTDEPHDLTPPIREGKPLPLWARAMVYSAKYKNAKNAPKWGVERFQTEDLIELWKQGGGRCQLTGLPFRETAVGMGKARHPFAPSLDRIDSNRPYSRRNCRLVLQAVNFALNAFGDDVFFAMAEGAIKLREAGEKAS